LAHEPFPPWAFPLLMTGRRVVRFFAPGHLTGFFVPATENPNPLQRGSIGAGLVLDRGVVAEIVVEERPGEISSVEIRERGVSARYPITEDACRRLIPPRGSQILVDLDHVFPISQGLGMSAAGALAASLAVATALGRSPEEAIAAAHNSELEHGGGLGGVAAILGGGLEVRRGPGIPPYGEVQRVPIERGFLLGVGREPLRTPDLLARPEFVGRVRRAGGDLWARFLDTEVTWESFFATSSRFSQAVRLWDRNLETAARRLTEAGIPVFQAMLGNTLVADVEPSGSQAPEVREVMESQGLHCLAVRTGRSGPRALPVPDSLS
jgi:pantoate kinase